MYNTISLIEINIQTFGRQNGKDTLYATLYKEHSNISTERYENLEHLQTYSPETKSKAEYFDFLGEVGYVEFRIEKGLLRKTLKGTVFLKYKYQNIKVFLTFEDSYEQDRYIKDKEKGLILPGINEKGRLYQKTDFEIKYY